MAPNIVYIHTHDTGRYVSPYGHALPTPNIMQLAREGVLFRKAFSAAPTCSPSRAAFLNGNWPHENGMIGLMHRGARLNDPSQHLANVLAGAGWQCIMSGFQHVAPEEELGELGYGTVLPVASNHAADVAPAAAQWIRDRDSAAPFFLSVGFSETHRPYPEIGAEDDPRYMAVPSGYPDTPEVREDTARLNTSLRAVDRGVGEVVAALRDAGVVEDTIVIFTTDHGLPWPNAKCNLNDAGTGVAMVMRGPGGFSGGKVIDAMVSQLDVFPTLMQLADLPKPTWLRGQSMMPLIDGSTDSLRDEVFAEVTCHAAAEPMRSIRTNEWRYVRRFDGSDLRVLANVDDGDAKSLFMEHGWHRKSPEPRALYNVVLDPDERINLADDPEYAQIVQGLDSRLQAWMEETSDPLLDPDWTPPPHFRLEDRRKGHDV